jgi:hypothetical protein
MLAPDAVPDDRQLLRYLLGRMPPEQSERLDEASIVDDHIASRLRVLEDDLIDDYVRDTLDRKTRYYFERVYLASPRRLERLMFAARFVAAVDRAPERAGAVTDRPSRRRLVGWSLVAVPAVLLLASVVFFFHDRGPRPPAAPLDTTPPAASGGWSW